MNVRKKKTNSKIPNSKQLQPVIGVTSAHPFIHSSNRALTAISGDPLIWISSQRRGIARSGLIVLPIVCPSMIVQSPNKHS